MAGVGELGAEVWAAGSAGASMELDSHPRDWHSAAPQCLIKLPQVAVPHGQEGPGCVWIYDKCIFCLSLHRCLPFDS